MTPRQRKSKAAPSPLIPTPSPTRGEGSEPSALRATSFTRPSLHKLQQAFAAGVYHDAATVLTHMRDGAFPATRQFQIYRHNTFANLTDALAACYPIVQRLVGERFFEHAVDGFIRRHPPRSGNLHDFGAEFSDFLAQFTPAQALVYLPDVARLEWRWQLAYHAADATTLALAELATIAPQDYADLIIGLQPSAQLLASRYPVLRIWQVNQPEFRGDAAVNLDEGAQQLLVVRRGLDIEIELLDTGDYALLCAFARAETLGQAHAAALAAQSSFDLASSLAHHVSAGTLVTFTASNSKK